MKLRQDTARHDAAGIAERATLARRHPVNDRHIIAFRLQVNSARDANAAGPYDGGVGFGRNHRMPIDYFGLQSVERNRP